MYLAAGFQQMRGILCYTLHCVLETHLPYFYRWLRVYLKVIQSGVNLWGVVAHCQSLVDSSPLVQRVVGLNPALAAM